MRIRLLCILLTFNFKLMKRNFRRIPDFISEKVDQIDSDYVIVAASVNLTQADIQRNQYPLLNASIDDGLLSYSSVITPNRLSGSYSRKNLNGFKITFRDQPKVSKTFYLGERPCWGDPSRGYFSLDVTKQVYPSIKIAPREWDITVDNVTDEIGHANGVYTLKLAVDVILDKNEHNFSTDLLFAINLLQENFGICDVFDSGASNADFLQTRFVAWEIFPPGTRDIVQEMSGTFRRVNPELQREIQQRVDFINGLNPIQMIMGRGLNSRYFGAKFSDNLVVFENAMYGNAIYVLFENWQQLSRLSRIEILQRPNAGFLRIPHRRGWEDDLRRVIAAKK